MDTALIVFVGITAWFALRGFWLGLPAVLVRLLALAAGYATAIFLAPGWVDWVDANTPLDGLAPYPATLLAAFFGAAFLANLIGSLVIRFSIPEERRHSGKVPAVILNGAFGALVALIAVWCVGLLQAAVYPGRASNPSALQHRADTLVAAAMARFVDTVSPGQPRHASITQQLMENPAQTVNDLRYMSNHNAMSSLLRDPDTQRYLKNGDIQQLQKSPAFREFTQDARAEHILLNSGFLPEGTTDTDYEQALATQLADTWQKIDAVRDHPEFQSIMNDADYRQKLQQSDVLSLINDDRSARLAELVWSPPAAEPAEQETPTDIHRWQDAEGHWHFSDKPAP